MTAATYLLGGAFFLKPYLHVSAAQDCVRSIDSTSVLIATRSALLTHGLQKFMDSLCGVTHVGSCSSDTAVIAGLREFKPDVVIIDLDLARTLPADVMRTAPARILLLLQTSHMGTSGDIDPDSICAALNERVCTKQLSSVLIKLRDCAKPRHAPPTCTDCPLRSSLEPPPLPLSPRERSIFEMIGSGERPAAIARELGVSVKTIETHRDNIKRKLGLETAIEVFAAALSWKRGDLLP